MHLPKSPSSVRTSNILVAGLLSSLCFGALSHKSNAQTADDVNATELHAEKLTNTAFTIRVLPALQDDGKKSQVTKDAVQSAITTIQKRIKGLGIKNFHAKAQGDEQITLELVSISKDQLDSARTTLTRPALLELKLVHPENRILADRVAADPENAVIPGYELKLYRDTDFDGTETKENILIRQRSSLDGSYIIHAHEQHGAYEGTLAVELNEEGSKRMFATTGAMNHGRDRLAIVLDGKVLSAPVVQAPLSKRFQITGMNNVQEAKALAIALQNQLKNPLKIEDERQFEPKPTK